MTLSRLLLGWLVASLLLIAPARADIFQLGEFTLVPGGHGGEYEFVAVIPEMVENFRTPVWPEGCSEESASRQSSAGRAQWLFVIECDGVLAADAEIQTFWGVDGARFLNAAGSGAPIERSFIGTADGISVPMAFAAAAVRPLGELATEFTWQGMLHIWFGWDHLAFVLCLCLLSRGRQLLELVSAFTIGHSISLGLAFFEVVSVPIPPVEAIIALSIAFMAREAVVTGRDAASLHRTRYMAVVIVFGLLHGLGFASALGELGVADGERAAGLIFFNIGVELGQVIFVGVITAVMALATKVDIARPMRIAALYSVGVIGAFWTVERVAGFPWA